jgi:hypothetical protein
LGIPGLILFAFVWLRWFQMGASFLLPRIPDPLRRMPVGIFFGFCGMFLQCLTEWVFRHLPLYYTFHVMLGVLMSLYYLKRKAKRAEFLEAESVTDESPHVVAWPEGTDASGAMSADEVPSQQRWAGGMA